MHNSTSHSQKPILRIPSLKVSVFLCPLNKHNIKHFCYVYLFYNISWGELWNSCALKKKKEVTPAPIKRNEEKCEHTAIRALGLKFTVWPLTHISWNSFQESYRSGRKKWPFCFPTVKLSSQQNFLQCIQIFWSVNHSAALFPLCPSITTMLSLPTWRQRESKAIRIQKCH